MGCASAMQGCRRTLMSCGAAALLAGIVLMLACGSASAQVGISYFSMRPANLQAGGSPNYTLITRLSNSGGDTAKNVTLSLAPGVAVYPVGQPTCSPAQLAAASCPARSQIGQGTTTATALGLLTLSIGTKLYLMPAPDGSHVNSIGAVATLLISIEIPITNTIRQSPTTGVDMHIDNAPNKLLNLIPVQLDGQNWTINGRVNGKPFTRVPTTCTTVTSLLRADSYKGTTATATDPFQPTGCSKLGFSASSTASAALDTSGNVTATANLLANATDSATASAVLNVPASLEPNVNTISAANVAGCTASTLSGCPVVGSLVVSTPLWGSPIGGKIYLVGHPGLLPTVTIVSDPPVPLVFQARFALVTGNVIQITLTGLPDVPVTSLALTLFGGAHGLLVPAPTLCAAPGSLSGTLTAQDGASVPVTAPITVSGCAGAPGQKPPPSPVNSGIGSSGTAARGDGFTIGSFQLTPSTGQASTNAAAVHPDLTANSTFSYPDATDSLKDAVLTLAPGLLANPTQVATTCSPTQLSANTCPADSQIGFGTVTANASGAQGEISGSQTLDTSIYLMPGQSPAEYARLGIVGSLAGTPLITLEGVATISPTGQAVLTISDIPRQSTIFDVTVDSQITGLSLTIHGTVAGKPFTDGPAECVAATSSAATDTYEGASQITATSGYTPTGCPPPPNPPAPLTGTATSAEGFSQAFSLTPSTKAIGANPSLTTSASFNYPDSSQAAGGPQNCADKLQTPGAECTWLRDATVLLPQGLLAIPASVTELCTPQQLTADDCPAASQFAVGAVSAYTYDTNNDDAWGQQNNLVVKLFEMPAVSPQEIREAGLILYLSGKPVVEISGPATLNADGRVQLTFNNLPSQAALGTGGALEWAQVTKLQITVSGTVDGNPFVVNPSGCQPATSDLVTDTSTAPGAAVDAPSTFVPTGC